MADTMATQQSIADARPASGEGAARREGPLADLVHRGYEDAAARALTGPAGQLHDDLAAGRLEVHYQAIVSLPDARLLGLEALARLRTRDGELVMPDRFIGLAESSGLITPLGLEVLGAAASMLARWRQDPAFAGVYVSVNVSARQLTDDSFTAAVREVLRAHALPASAIVLEVTESSIAGDDAIHAMAVAEATGVRLALDDFGTGFATLESLKRLPVQILKLDRTFVSGIGDGGFDTVIVRNVLDLAYELDLAVVAEGVETPAQAASLAAWGCTAAQGWLFGRPTPADSVTATVPAAEGPGPRAQPVGNEAGRAAAAVAQVLALADEDGGEQRALVHTVATGIGKAMRLPAATVHEIELLALCHDVERLQPLWVRRTKAAGLPAVLRPLLGGQRGPDGQRLSAQVVDVAATVVRGAYARSPDDHGRLVEALRATAIHQPHGIAQAMRQLADNLPTIAPAVHDLLRPTIGPGDAVRSVDERLRDLQSLCRAIDPSAGFRDLVALLAEEACEIIGAASLSLSRWLRDDGVLQTLVNVGRLGDTEERFPTDEVYRMADFISASRMLTAGQPRVERVTDPDCDPAEKALLEELGKGSYASVPVYTADRLWGELYVTTGMDEPPFTARDFDLLTTVADILGSALAHGEQMERMASLAFEDALTGLPNRRAVDSRLQKVLETTDTPVAVVMLDVNGLKQVNDEYGHEMGDRTLCSVADALSAATLDEPGATCARLGGDEFCIVIVDDDLNAVDRIVQRAADLLRRAPAPQVTISAGAARSAHAGRTVRTMFSAADKAQYQAKRARELLLFADATGRVPEPVTDQHRRRGADTDDPVASAVDAVCRAVVDLLGRVADTPTADVLEAIADTLAAGCDLSRWSFSRIDASGVIRTRRHRVRRVRPATSHGSVVLPEDEMYLLDDYPLTRTAVHDCEPFWIHADRDDHDAAERAVLGNDGMRAVLGLGGRDEGGGWLLELYADEHSDDLEPLLPLARVVCRSFSIGTPAGERAPRSPDPTAVPPDEP